MYTYLYISFYLYKLIEQNKIKVFPLRFKVKYFKFLYDVYMYNPRKCIPD